MRVKLSLIENKIASIAVRIPTKHIMPTAMIIKVRNDLKKLVLRDKNAIFIFSRKLKPQFYIFSNLLQYIDSISAML